MAEEAQAQPAQAQPAADANPSGGGGSKIIVIVSVVNLVVTLAIVGILFVSFQKEKSKTGVEDISADASHGGGHGKEEKKEGGGHGEAAKEGGHDGAAAGGHGAAEATDAGKMIALDPFTINLTNGGGSSPKYVRLNISVELEQGVTEKEFEAKIARVRDTVISLINSKKASELSAVDGREVLKKEMVKSLNEFMLQSKVKGVYFTNFAVSN